MDEQPSGWAMGWTAFAGIMMVLGGGWWIISGLIALFNSDFYVVGQEYVFQFDATTWGWVHLLIGIVILLAGFGLFSGAVWARTVAVIIAMISAVVAFAWLPWYPVTAVVFIIVSGTIIWALTVHGRDLAEA